MADVPSANNQLLQNRQSRVGGPRDGGSRRIIESITPSESEVPTFSDDVLKPIEEVFADQDESDLRKLAGWDGHMALHHEVVVNEILNDAELGTVHRILTGALPKSWILRLDRYHRMKFKSDAYYVGDDNLLIDRDQNAVIIPPKLRHHASVSYTHLTLPTILLV